MKLVQKHKAKRRALPLLRNRERVMVVTVIFGKATVSTQRSTPNFDSGSQNRLRTSPRLRTSTSAGGEETACVAAGACPLTFIKP